MDLVRYPCLVGNVRRGIPDWQMILMIGAKYAVAFSFVDKFVYRVHLIIIRSFTFFLNNFTSYLYLVL